MLHLFKSLRKCLVFIFILPIIFIVPGCGGGGGGGDSGVATDTTPPPVPTGLTATAVSASRINLSWSAATDAVGYNLYRNGVFYQNVYGTTSFADTNLTANTPFTYRVSAYDSAGNESSQSASASATTQDSATVLVGTAVNDYARGVALDNGGNIYVTGWTAGALDGQSNPNGADIFLTKYNASGVRQWTRLLGTTGVAEPYTNAQDFADFGLNVAVDNTNQYVYVTGYTTADMNGQTILAPGVRSVFLFRCKFDNSLPGTVLFTQSYEDNVGNAVAVDPSGNVYVAGYYTSGGTTAILLLKFGPSLGAPIYRMTGSTGPTAVATGVAVDAGNNAVYLTGLTTGVLPLNTLTRNYSGGGDLFLARFDFVPNLQWTTYLGSSALDAGLAICMDGSDIHVAGVTGGALPGQTSAGGNDAFAAKFNNSGGLLWTTQFGTIEDDSAFGIVVDSIGNSYVSGFSSGSLSFSKPNQGLEDQFMARLGVGGGVFSYTTSGTSGGDEARAIAIRESSNLIYTVGFTAGNLDELNSGGIDATILKFNTAGDQL